MATTGLALEIGRRIRALRHERGWSQSDLARHAGLASKAVISTYELGDRYPSYETLLRFAYVFGVSTDFLLTGNNENAPANCTEVSERATGDTFIRIKAGTLTKKQIKALFRLIDTLAESDETDLN